MAWGYNSWGPALLAWQRLGANAVVRPGGGGRRAWAYDSWGPTLWCGEAGAAARLGLGLRRFRVSAVVRPRGGQQR